MKIVELPDVIMGYRRSRRSGIKTEQIGFRRGKLVHLGKDGAVKAVSLCQAIAIWARLEAKPDGFWHNQARVKFLRLVAKGCH